MPVEKKWYFASNDERQGPISFDNLRSLATQGRFGKDDLVWSRGMSDWQLASTVDGLFPKSTPVLARSSARNSEPLTASAQPQTVKIRERKSATKLPLFAGVGFTACAIFAIAYWLGIRNTTAISQATTPAPAAAPVVAKTSPAPPPEPSAAPPSQNASTEVAAPDMPQASVQSAPTVAAALSAEVSRSSVQSSEIPPSFDCRRASTITEKAICANPDLRSLDGQLGRAFSDVIALAPVAQLRRVRAEQVAWIRERDATCSGDSSCLNRYLRERLSVLQQIKSNGVATSEVAAQSLQAQSAYRHYPATNNSEIQIVRQYAPKYPPQAMREHHTGKAVLKILVATDGSPKNIEVESSSGFGELDQAAIATAKTWTFSPKILDGEPQEAYVIAPVDFTLSGASSELQQPRSQEQATVETSGSATAARAPQPEMPSTPTVAVDSISFGHSASANGEIRKPDIEFGDKDTIFASVRATVESSTAQSLDVVWASSNGRILQKDRATLTSGPHISMFNYNNPQGLPVGQYNLGVYVGGKLVSNNSFSITPSRLEKFKNGLEKFGIKVQTH